MERIYLDNASTAFPKAEGVAEAVYHYLRDCGCNVGRGGYDMAYSAEETVFRTRQQLADYLSVERSGLSLELGRMRDEGLLAFCKNHFVLKAPGAGQPSYI